MTDVTGEIPWEAPKAPPALVESVTPGHTLTFADVAPAQGEASVEVALRWSKLYEKDIEYEPFFNWIGRRSNPERTDRHEILESVPLRWGPSDLPPPLRRYFLSRFNK